MKKYAKIFTDNPFIDELIYFTKTIAINAVIKDDLGAISVISEYEVVTPEEEEKVNA